MVSNITLIEILAIAQFEDNSVVSPAFAISLQHWIEHRNSGVERGKNIKEKIISMIEDKWTAKITNKPSALMPKILTTVMEMV